MSAQGWRLISPFFEGQTLPTGDVHITTLVAPLRNVSLKKTPVTGVASLAHVVDSLKRYVPAAIVPHISQNQASWSGELRHVTVGTPPCRETPTLLHARPARSHDLPFAARRCCL